MKYARFWKILYLVCMLKIKQVSKFVVVQIKVVTQKVWVWVIDKISGDEIKNSTTLRPPIREAIRFGVIVLIIFFGIFGLWAILAPLESAAVAPGKVVVATNRKTIEHLEGGIVRQIYIHEGEVVQAGAPLLKLDDTQAKATYDDLHSQANELYATEARLIAERDQASTIQFPQALIIQQNDPEIQKLFAEQQAIFENNQKSLTGQLEILNDRIAQLQKEIESDNAQVESNDTQLAYVQQELTALKILDAKHIIAKPELWASEREAARLNGNRGEEVGKIAETQEKIGETRQQIITLKDDVQKEILQQLNDTQTKLLDVLEREKNAEYVLRRTTIVAPEAGTIVGLQEHTVGGVISPGKPILDIVPSNDQLIIEARVTPIDIDSVHPGLVAKVQLIAYRRRSMPWVDGTVTTVSADSFQDTQTNTTYYTARVTISAQELRRLKNLTLYPGMPVQVMIITDRRTPFDYFIEPIKDSFNNAFREQ